MTTHASDALYPSIIQLNLCPQKSHSLSNTFHPWKHPHPQACSKRCSFRLRGWLVRCHRCRGLSGRLFGRFLEAEVISNGNSCEIIKNPTCEDVLESKLNVACIESGRFNKREVILACLKSVSTHSRTTGNPYLQTASPPP
jgi:hypothetical protein